MSDSPAERTEADAADPPIALRPGPLAPWLTAAALTWLARAITDGLQPAFGEPLVLRWLRAASDHPLRLAGGMGLLLWAFWPRRARGVRAGRARGLREPAEGPPTGRPRPIPEPELATTPPERV